jgi:hypothetical protein
MKAIALGILGVALVLGPLIFGHPVRDLRSWRNASSWEAVQAKVTAVSQRRVNDDGRPRTEVDVRYAYTYQGKLREELYRIEDAALHKVPNKGDELTLRINPRDPSDALFNPESELPMRALGLFALAGFGLYLLFMVFTGRAEDIPVSFGSTKDDDER